MRIITFRTLPLLLICLGLTACQQQDGKGTTSVSAGTGSGVNNGAADSATSSPMELERILLSAPAVPVGNLEARVVLSNPKELRVYVSHKADPRPAIYVTATAKVPAGTGEVINLTASPQGRYLVGTPTTEIVPPVDVALTVVAISGESAEGTVQVKATMPSPADAPVADDMAASGYTEILRGRIADLDDHKGSGDFALLQTKADDLERFLKLTDDATPDNAPVASALKEADTHLAALKAALGAKDQAKAEEAIGQLMLVASKLADAGGPTADPGKQ